MLFRKMNLLIMMKKIFFSIVIGMLLIFTLSACEFQKGYIVIREDGQGTSFTVGLTGFSSNSKCELILSKGDEVKVEVKREFGEIGLTVTGKNGSEPYTGNDLQSGIFTFTVSETDVYVFKIKGNNATGKIWVRKLADDGK